MDEEEYSTANREDRIKIANEMLSALLLQGSEDPLKNGDQPHDDEDDVELDETGKKKVYVDWPDDEDEHQYRFVSSRVEDYPGDTDRPSPEPYDSLDMSAAPQQPSRIIIPLSTPTRPSDRSADPGVMPMPEPARYTGHTVPNAEEEEQELLREEYLYQNALKNRVQENQMRDSELNVPPLNLKDLEQSEEFRNQNDMVEISVRSTHPQHVDNAVVSQPKMPKGVGKFSDYVDSSVVEDRWEEKAQEDDHRRNNVQEDGDSSLPYNHRVEYSTELNAADSNRNSDRDERRIGQSTGSRNGYSQKRGVYSESQQGVPGGSQQSVHTRSQHSMHAQSQHTIHTQSQHSVHAHSHHSMHDQSHHSMHSQPHVQSKHSVHASSQHSVRNQRHMDDRSVLDSPVLSKPPQSPYYQARESPNRTRIPQPSPKRSRPRSRDPSPRRSPHHKPTYHDDVIRIPTDGTYDRYPSEHAYPDSRQTYPRQQDYPYADQAENQYYENQAKSRSRLAERISAAEQQSFYDQRYPTNDQYYYAERRRGSPPRYQDPNELARIRADESRQSHNRIEQAGMELESEYESQRARRFSESSLQGRPAQKVRQSHRSLEDIPGSARRGRKPEKTPVNYIEKNKQTYGRNTQQSGYKSMFAKKQEVYQQQTNSAPGRLPARKPPLPGIKPQPREDSWEEAEPLGAERLWAQRSRALHQQTSVSPKKRIRNFTSNPDLRSIEPETSVIKRIDSHPANLHHHTEPQKVSIDLNVKITPQGFQIANGEVQSRWGPRADVDEGTFVHEQPSHYIRPYADPYVLDKAFKSPRDLSLQERTPSDLDKLAYSQTVTNPFTPLPPIKTSQSDDEHEDRIVTNGYLAMFKKDQDVKKGVVPRHYKPYSLNDYKRMQKDVKLGGLGPDTDSDVHKEKMAKKLKAEEYARQVQEKNNQQKQQQAARAARAQQPAPAKRDVFSPSIVLGARMASRKAALDYAKKLKRPSSKTKPKDTATDPVINTPKNNINNAKPRQKNNKKAETETIDLQRLLERHERDKENVAAVRGHLMEV